MSRKNDVLAEIQRIREAGLREIEDASDAAALEAARIRHLARKAPLSGILRGLGELEPAERARIGQAANTTRRALEEAVLRREEALGPKPVGPGVDPTRPGLRPARGHAHVLTQTEDLILSIFRGMGFGVARIRDVEDDYHNF